jgi:glycosyltransferase involved in cell wall biosynthesis
MRKRRKKRKKGESMKVSIVIINYNDKLRVKRAIDSAINQTYKDIEVIVVDDGSDEETRKLYDGIDNINLIQLERNDVYKRTPSRARNKGIKTATGEYICFLDSDNYYDKDFITECLKYQEDVMFCNWQIFGKESYDVDISRAWDWSKPILDNYLLMTHLDHQCLLIKKEILDKVGKYDERLPRSQDCDMIVRLMLKTKKWRYIPKTLFYFEKHEDDQMKIIASIHGKMLWTLKLGVAWDFLMQRVIGNPFLFLALIKAYNDFTTLPEWKEDFEKSNYKKIVDEFNKRLISEVRENAM